MISAKRHMISLFMAAVYLLITISPLTPFAMKSPRLAHAITGECSGECDICGCSPERRASRTCCCWQKKLKQNHLHKDDNETTPACCKNKAPRKKLELTGNCPCGSGKQIAVWGAEKIQHLPYHFSDGIPVPMEDSIHLAIPDRLASRHVEPPDPPPKLTSLS